MYLGSTLSSHLSSFMVKCARRSDDRGLYYLFACVFKYIYIYFFFIYWKRRPPFHCFGTPIWPPWRHYSLVSCKLLRTSNNTLYPALTASFTAERDDILLTDEIVPAPPWTMMQGLNEGFLWAVISAFPNSEDLNFFGLEDLGTRTDCFSRWRRILFKSTIRTFNTVLTLPCA